MADTKAKKDSARGSRNDSRRNRKAWKRRPCGDRHEPGPGCVRCVGVTTPTLEQSRKAEARREIREQRAIDARRAANARPRDITNAA
jgi:hypothetical protein